MPAPRESLYEVLGVARDAKPGDISRAHDRLSAEFRKDTTPPDPRREARIREAFAVLSDPAQREAYDASLVQHPVAPDRRRVYIVGGIAAVLLAGAALLIAGRTSPPAKPGRTVAEIQADIVSSVGRVQSIDMAGRVTPTGIAFTVARGVMATTCEGLAPGTQIVVLVGTRPVPARIAQSDEALGLCKLAVDGAGSWPLALSDGAPAVGDKVYAAGVNAAGEVVLAEGSVKRVMLEAGTKIVEASVASSPHVGGRPLLNAQGMVVAVAIANRSDGISRHAVVPAAWASEPAPQPAAPPASARPEPAPSPPATADSGSAPAPALPGPMQKHAEETARKLRPPPKVPDDL